MDKEDNTVFAVLIALLVFLALGGGFGMMGFSNYGGMYGMMNGFYGGFGFMWLFGWLIMVLVLITLVLFIIWLIKQVARDERGRK